MSEEQLRDGLEKIRTYAAERSSWGAQTVATLEDAVYVSEGLLFALVCIRDAAVGILRGDVVMIEPAAAPERRAPAPGEETSK
jgi:hypothetical protein